MEKFHISLAGFTHVETPQFARGNVFANQPTQQQLREQDQYKAFLKQQVRPLLDGIMVVCLIKPCFSAEHSFGFSALQRCC